MNNELYVVVLDAPRGHWTISTRVFRRNHLIQLPLKSPCRVGNSAHSSISKLKNIYNCCSTLDNLQQLKSHKFSRGECTQSPYITAFSSFGNASPQQSENFWMEPCCYIITSWSEHPHTQSLTSDMNRSPVILLFHPYSRSRDSNRKMRNKEGPSFECFAVPVPGYRLLWKRQLFLINSHSSCLCFQGPSLSTEPQQSLQKESMLAAPN